MAGKSARQIISGVYASLGKRLGKGLLDEMVQTKTLKPSWTLSKVLAFALSIAIYAVVVWVTIWGVLWIVNGFPNPFAILLGLVLLLFGIMARPCVDKFPKEFETAADYPKFFAAVEKIADALNARTISAVVFNWDYNAAFGQRGWRRRAVLWLGVPLFTALHAQERVALLAHELAHGVNGDPNRGFFVHTALNSLGWWYVTLHGDRVEVYSIAGTVANVLMRIASGVPWALWNALAHLIWRDSQRAEYLADYLASQVSGTDAQLGLLRKMRHSTHYYQLAKEIALQPIERDLYAELASHIGSIPPTQESDSDAAEEYDLDLTHPPTPYRIRFLQAHSIADVRPVVSQAEWDAIDEELVPVRRAMQEKITDRYKSSFVLLVGEISHFVRQ